MSDATAPGASHRKRPLGLGRGLSALLGDVQPEPAAGGGEDGVQTVRTVAVTLLEPHPEQPRRHFDSDALDELARSISERGVLQPIVVRAHGRGYQIVAGERRWRAAQRARLQEVPVIVRDFDDAQTLEIALIENIQREDLNAIEEAEAYRRLLDQFGHTQEALARLVNKSRSHVTNLLRLLELPKPVQKHVMDGKLSMGHARALIGAPESERLAERIIDRGLSVRDTEQLTREAKPGRARSTPANPPAPPVADDADVAALERQLGDLLGLGVAIAFGEQGGTITISYATLDQLDMVCQRLSGDAI